MQIAVERLLIKLRQPASRADELIQLRQRLRDELASDVDEEERSLARVVHERKLAVAAELRAVASCTTCATGPFDGGACCSGVTAELFDDAELAGLAHTGTRPRDLVPPHDEHAGCAFRGRTGCTLAIAHRPARCVHYMCNTLRRELHSRGQLDTIEAKLAELGSAMRQFSAVHHGRRNREVIIPLIEAIDAARRQPG